MSCDIYILLSYFVYAMIKTYLCGYCKKKKKRLKMNEDELIWFLFACIFINLISLGWVASMADIGCSIVIYESDLQK